MKKYLIIASLLIAKLSQAQTQYQFTDIFGGVTLPNYTFSNNGTSSARDIYQGFSGGIFESVYTSGKGLSLHGGMSYVQKGAINNTPGTGYTKAQNRISYVQGDILLGFVLGKKNFYKQLPVEILAGFYYGFGVIAKQKLTAMDGTVSNPPLRFGYDYKRGDLGGKVGLFLPIGNKLFLSGAYEYGFSNIAVQNDIKIKNRNISITAGFHLRRPGTR